MMTDDHLHKQGANKDFIDNQWKPGQSGNPGGRAKGKSITAELRKLLDKGTLAEDIAQVLVDLARDGKFKGNIPALKELLDRVDGKVLDTHRIETGEVTIIYKQVDEDAAKQEEKQG